MTALSSTQRWLQSVLGPYADAALVYAHVDALLARYPSLSPRTAMYTHDDGRTQLLLCVGGTLQISFKARPFNIPVAIWIRHGHPREPPIVFVTPTATMLVRPSRAVDVSGRVRDERPAYGVEAATYLEHWASKPEGCDLVRLAESLIALWSAAPPVYARPAASPSPSPVSPVASTSYRPAPVPPQPASPAPVQPQRPMIPPRPPPRPAEDLLDAVDQVAASSSSSAGPAPLRPLNPELAALRQALHAKLVNAHTALHTSHQAFAQRQAAFAADLAKGEPALLDEMARLEAVRDVCRTVATRYGELVARAEANVADVAARTDVPVDEIVCASTVVGNQCVGQIVVKLTAHRLLDLVADDSALQDTMYQLSRALDADPPRIDTERFLKVRR